MHNKYGLNSLTDWDTGSLLGETKVFWVFLFFLQQGQLTEHTPWCQVRGLPPLPLLQLEGQQVRPGHYPRDLLLRLCGSASSRGDVCAQLGARLPGAARPTRPSASSPARGRAGQPAEALSWSVGREGDTQRSLLVIFSR